jgi:SAM-dependent methyltransferase
MERRTESLAEAGPGWFAEHHAGAAQEIIDFLGGDGITLEGRRVADVGSGDGVIDLGLVQRAAPAALVGFDIVPTNAATLLERARTYGVADELPPALSFAHSEPARLPAPDASFDVVVSWSAFEHIADVGAVLREVRRVLRPDGVFFLQLWPFFYSPLGSHLWEWCPEPYHHLAEPAEETRRRVRTSGHEPEFAEMMLREFGTLNRITVDELGAALLASELAVRKLELLPACSHVPAAALRHPLSALGVSGVKLLATPLMDTELALLRSPRRRDARSLAARLTDRLRRKATA